MKKVILFFLIFIMSGFVDGCINTQDDFAVEVVVENYSFLPFSSAQNYYYLNGSYIILSDYSKKIAAKLSKDNYCDDCLSIKLQIPVQLKVREVPYLNIVSSIYNKKINLKEGVTNYKDWSILKTEDSIELKKNKVNIFIGIVKNKYDLIIEINEELKNCEICDGYCISGGGYNVCIPKNIKEDIEGVLVFTGLIKDFRNIFGLYRIAGYGKKLIEDLEPDINPKKIDWEEAMRQELVFLNKNKVIDLDKEDIERIVSLSKQGKAGNSKIVYDNGEWKYYYELENVEILPKENCQEFLKTNMPKNPVDFNGGISLYYIVPLFITLALVIFIFILILIGRFIVNRKFKKKE